MKDILENRWSHLRLAQQYAIASLVVLLCGMFVIGAWVSEKVQSGVIDNTAVSAALYLNSFVAPELDELVEQDSLSEQAIRKLDEIYDGTDLKNHVESFKIWGMDGQILYSTTPEMIGRVFPIQPDKQRAWSGGVIGELSDLDQAEHVAERDLGIPLLEIYSPIRAGYGNKIIAVAEFYDNATKLAKQLSKARIQGWFVVAGTTLVMFSILFGIVMRGSRTITRQQNEAQRRVTQLSDLLTQNRVLRRRDRDSSHRAVELNERFLNRLGSDLHDGPAQTIGYSLLRLDTLRRGTCDCGKKPASANVPGEFDNMRLALSEALEEIRVLSRGLALPELATLTLSEVLKHVVLSFRRRTGNEVQLNISNLPSTVSSPIKICLYRVVQEALNNAHHHSDASVQSVTAREGNDCIKIVIADNGSGFEVSDSDSPAAAHRLGLIGMRRRVEGLGGHLELKSALGKGTQIAATIPIDVEKDKHRPRNVPETEPLTII